MKTYQKLALFLVRLTTAAVMLLTAFRIIQILASVISAGFNVTFKQFSGAMLLAASPFLIVLILHWTTNAIVGYLSRGLDE